MQLADLTNDDTCSTSFPTATKKAGTSKPKAVERLEEELDALLSKIDDGEFFPCSSTGKQITPNSMRADIRKHLAETGKNQTKFQDDIRVSAASYGKFMNGKYKDQWSAVQNGTYHAAGVYLAQYRIQKKIDDLMSKKADAATTKNAKSSEKTSENISKKRPAEAEGDEHVPSTKKSKTDMDNQLAAIAAVSLGETPVYANCDEVRQMINKYLISSGVNQTRWLKCISAGANSLIAFRKMKGKGAGASNMIYPLAWRFFEKKRILEKKPKSSKRLEQEARWGPEGFRLDVYIIAYFNFNLEDIFQLLKVLTNNFLISNNSAR